MTTIVTRAGKGSALTWTEGDANITNLNNDKIELTDLSVGAEGTPSGNGSIAYNNTTGVFTFTPADADEASRTTTIYGKANEAIAKGDLVMFGGVQGDHVLLLKADASAIGFIPEWIIGIAPVALSTNDFGYIVTQGEVTGIDTATDFTVGDILYMDPATAGALTSTKPTAPNPKITIAAVTKEDATEGIILVRIGANSINLPDVNDVYIPSTPSDGQVLTWDNGNARWNAETIAYTETDPVVGAINGLVKANGAGTISAAVAGTDYLASETFTELSQDTTPALGGELTCGGNVISDSTLKDYKETIYSLGSTDSPTITIANGNVQSVTISAGLSLPAFSDAAAGQSVTLLVSGSGNASGTGAYKFAGGSKTLTTSSVVSIFYDGTTYWTSIATDFQA